MLEGVGERVPEVEDRSACFLEGIVLDDRDLDLDGERNQRLQAAQRVTFLVTQRVPLASFELIQQMRTGDQGMLDHLRHPRRELAATQRLQRCHVGDHGRRLLVQADQVLALRHIEPDLAADAGVDHGDQISRAVHEVETAEVRRRREAGHVADDRVAERHDRRRSIDVGIEQGVVDVLHGRQVLLTAAARPAA